MKYLYTIKNPSGRLICKDEDLEVVLKREGFPEKQIKNLSKRFREAAQYKIPYKEYIVTRIEKPIEKKIEIVPEIIGKSILTPDEKVLRLSEENSSLKIQIKDLTRNSSLFKELAEVIRESSAITDIKPYIKPKKQGKINESAILLLSDLHGDTIIKSERVQGLEDFNFNVCCKRAEKIVDTTITHLNDNLLGYKFDTLYIFGLGDYVSGEIHQATQHSQWQNSIKNSIGVGELIAHMIKDLSEHFEKIVFISISGNHGRRTVKKHFKDSLDNWDYLVAMQVQTRLKQLIDNNKLEVIIPNSWSVMVKIHGYNFLLSHGDGIPSFSGIPWYGLNRLTNRLISIGAVTGEVPNYCCFGHFHQSTSLTNITGETFVNGSFNFTDEFALNSLGAASEPVQILMGVHELYGSTWRIPIRLRTKNWKIDEKIPSRYQIKID
jgi:hypothetical protein